MTIIEYSNELFCHFEDKNALNMLKKMAKNIDDDSIYYPMGFMTDYDQIELMDLQLEIIKRDKDIKPPQELRKKFKAFAWSCLEKEVEKTPKKGKPIKPLKNRRWDKGNK